MSEKECTSKCSISTKKVAIVLSGCGVYDGSEIMESVVAILAVRHQGAAISFFAPDIAQYHVVNHLSGGSDTSKLRNVLVESARIARGNIVPLSEYNAKDFDALIFPGGFGAAKNLSGFAYEGVNCSVNEDVVEAIKTSLKEGVKMGFMCIAPTLAAKVIGNGVELTIGNDASTAAAINAMGAKHIDCAPESFVKDSKLEVYSTPAFMLADCILKVEAGTEAMVKAMLSD